MAIIFITALAIRLFVFFCMKDTIWYNVPIGDAQFYDAWAQAIVSGKLLGEKVFFMNPGYPYMLALVYAVFGHIMRAVILLQVFIGSLNCVLVYLIAEKIFNKKIALIAGLMACFYALSIFYEGMLLTCTFIVFFNLISTLLLMKAEERGSFKYNLLAGMSIGISILLRPNVLALVPVLLGWFIIRKKKPAVFAGFILGIFIMLAPVVSRNYFLSRRFVVTTVSAGMNFYIGNNPSADGTYSPAAFENANPENQQESYRKEASRKTGRELDLKEASGYWEGQAFDYILKNPFSWIVLLGRKTVLFFNSSELPTNINYYFVKNRSIFNSLQYVLLNFGIILPFALLGIILSFRKIKENRNHLEILYIFIISYLLSALVFFVGSEYRYPVVPYFIIPAAYALSMLYETLLRKDYKKIAIYCGFAFLLGILVNLKAYHIEEVTSHNNLGVVYLNLNRADEALAEFREAMKLDPNYIDTYNNMAGAYNLKGDYDMAVKYFRYALEKDPDYVEAYNNLGSTLFQKKLWDQSIALFSKALEINPNYSKAYYGMAEAYYNKNMIDKAIRYFKKTIEIDPDFSGAYFELGNIYTDRNMPDEAIYFYGKAAQFDAVSAEAYNNIGALYFQKKMYKEAAEQFSKAMKLKPDMPGIHENYERSLYYCGRRLQ